MNPEHITYNYITEYLSRNEFIQDSTIDNIWKIKDICVTLYFSNTTVTYNMEEYSIKDDSEYNLFNGSYQELYQYLNIYLRKGKIAYMNYTLAKD